MSGKVDPVSDVKIQSQINIWSILATVVGVVVTVVTLQSVTTALAKTVDDHEQRIRALETRVLVTLERMDGRLSNIEKDLKK